jgi:hypothetical protein
MNHFISEAELLEMADLEDKLGCSISAGLDWGDQISEFLSHYFDSNKLAEVLTDDLGDIVLDSEI